MKCQGSKWRLWERNAQSLGDMNGMGGWAALSLVSLRDSQRQGEGAQSLPLCHQDVAGVGSNVCGSEGLQGCPHLPQACLGVGLCLSPFTGLSPKSLRTRWWLINSSYRNDNYYL